MADVRQDEGVINMFFRRGDDFEFNIRVPGDVDGEYEDIATPYTHLAQIRLKPDSDEFWPVTVTPFDNGPTDRGLNVLVPHGVSQQLGAKRAKNYTWDLEFTAIADGKKRTWFAGTVTVTKDTSRVETP